MQVAFFLLAAMAIVLRKINWYKGRMPKWKNSEAKDTDFRGGYNTKNLTSPDLAKESSNHDVDGFT